MRGQVFRVGEGGFEMGRAPDNDLVIQDDGVSRFHARLLFDNGSLWLRDAGSRNGVFVNGDRVIDHKALKVGDVVRLGESEFEVAWRSMDEDPLASAAPAPPERPGPALPPTVTDETPESAEPKSGRRRWYWPFE